MMSPGLISLGIDRLSVEERLSLIGDIWESIEEESHPLPISEELGRELDRRWAEHEANPKEGVPWEQVKAKIYARWGG